VGTTRVVLRADLLAGAALAHDEYRGIGRGHARHQVADLLHARRGAEQEPEAPDLPQRRTQYAGEIAQWSLTTRREKVVKIGAMVIAHGRYLVFQMAEVPVPRELFGRRRGRIARLRPMLTRAGRLGRRRLCQATGALTGIPPSIGPQLTPNRAPVYAGFLIELDGSA